MSLPYVRDLAYISQSSLRLFESDPVEFYLSKLGPLETKPPFESSIYMDVGVAFDFLAKQSAKMQLGLEHAARPTKNVEAHKRAAEFWQGYVVSGAWVRWLDLKPVALDVNPGVVECVPGAEGLPIRVELDAQLDGLVVMDWKTTGAMATRTVTPKPGYSSLWSTKKPGEDLGPYRKGVYPLEQVDEKWATQACMYGWAIGVGMEAHRVVYDYICPLAEGGVRVARYDTVVSSAFKYQVRRRLKAMWEAVENRTVVDPRLLGMGEPFIKGGV